MVTQWVSQAHSWPSLLCLAESKRVQASTNAAACRSLHGGPAGSPLANLAETCTPGTPPRLRQAPTHLAVRLGVQLRGDKPGDGLHHSAARPAGRHGGWQGDTRFGPGGKGGAEAQRRSCCMRCKPSSQTRLPSPLGAPGAPTPAPAAALACAGRRWCAAPRPGFPSSPR